MENNGDGRAAGQFFSDPSTRLLNESEVATALGLKTATLRRWRWAGRGPRFIKFGFAVRYDPEDVVAYVEAARRASTSDPGPVAA